jgi:hypothetical protein
MKASIKITVLSIFCSLYFSCEDFVEVTNHSGIPADDFITSVDNAQTALNGVYDGLYGTNLFYFRIYYYLLFATSELEPMNSEEEMRELVDFAYYDGTKYVSGYWKDLYSILSRANDVCSKIYLLRNSGNLTDAENQQLDQMIGECNFLRGLAYFYLTRSFGDKLPSHPAYNPEELGVPIVDTLIVSKEQLMIPRNTLKQCWDEIIRDFETAYYHLPAVWSNEKLGAATQGAAAGYLGQVHMYFKNYEKAKEWFEKAMYVAPYELTENYAWNFDFNHENNSESIFEVQFQATSSYADLASYLWRRLGPNGFGMVKVSLDWVNKFSVGYQLTQEVYDEVTGQTIFGAPDLVLVEVMKAYQAAIGVSVFSPEEFFALYTGDWDALGDQINAALRASKYRLNVKNEPGWGTVNSSYIQNILNRIRAADPRMYDSFYVPDRDSISLDWAGTQVVPYGNADYGFKKYIPYNAVESWASEGLPYTDGFNSINQRIFRLADLYLQYAEACYPNDMNNAKKYLNKVRRRAWGLPFDDASLTTPETVDFPTSEDDPSDFLKAIIAEREKELCLEGHLWFDYLRWNKAEELFSHRGFDPEKHHRLPIPLSERQIAGMNILLQNNGY